MNHFIYAIDAALLIAFMINIIVGLTKNIGKLKYIPTTFYVIVWSIIICEASYFGAASYFNTGTLWYEAFAVFIASFAVAYISMYGFDKFVLAMASFKSKTVNAFPLLNNLFNKIK
jgi:hypothetical protein